MTKIGYFSITICLLFHFLFRFHLFILSFVHFILPSFTPQISFISIQHMSFQRQKQSFLFNKKGRAGSRYFEGNMKGRSGHSMLILDWTLSMAVLYSLCICVGVCTWVYVHACGTEYFAPPPPYQCRSKRFGNYVLDLDIAQESMMELFSRGGGRNK